MNNTLDERLAYFGKHYDVLVNIELTEKVVVGNDRKICRYCGKTDKDVSFRKIAHSFPELIGNKLLFSNDECDSCNEWFDKNLENELANFLGVSRTVSAIKGKKGIPVHKSNSRISLEMKTDLDKILTLDNDDVVKRDESKKTMEIIANKNPYIPIAVFKCFIKMAIAIMPESELSKFSDTIQWLRHGNNFDENHKYTKCISMFRNMEQQYINATLFKRANSSSPVPYMIFMLIFKYFAYQIAIPFSKKDRCQFGKDLSMVAFPLTDSQVGIIDLSKTDRVYDGKTILSFSYGNYEPRNS